jgi:ribosome-associated protein
VVTESRDVAIAAARAAASKQGEAIVILDVHDLIAITDYFVIASGTSERQVTTIAEEISKELKGRKLKSLRREGDAGARWVLLDFGDVVVHVFHDEEREFYRLENLWRDAPLVEWDSQARVSSSG